MRTKEEMAVILANHKKQDYFQASQWSDLVSAISGITQTQKDALMALLISGDDIQFGYEIRTLLLDNAFDRSKANVDVILTDDAVTLTELDELLS